MKLCCVIKTYQKINNKQKHAYEETKPLNTNMLILINKNLKIKRLIKNKLYMKKLFKIYGIYFNRLRFDFKVKLTMLLFCITLFQVQASETKIINTTLQSQQQSFEISGTIVDINGQPLPGTNIKEKGTTNGTQTDFDGKFSLTVSSENAILIVSYIGFKTQEYPLNGSTTINVTLEEDTAALDEVVVVGYGTARRKDVAGSVSTLKLEDSPIANNPTTNLLQSLQGVSPGLNVTPQNSPGASPGILVRGQNSINGSNDPLIVLDGVIFLGSIRDLNPNDIASFDILKDALAASAYGSRSANGVIVITTKKGKIGKPIINISSIIGANSWRDKYDMMSLDTFERKFAAQLGVAVEDLAFDHPMANAYLEQRIDTNWMDLISRSGFIQNQQLSVSGRTDNMDYYFSGGYSKEEGVIVGDDYERISLRARLNTDITDWLEVGIDGTYNNNDYSGIGASVGNAYLMQPIGYPYRYDDQPNNAATNSSRLLERWPVGSSVQNPLWGTDGTIEDVDKSDFFRFSGHALVKLPVVKGLSYRFNYSIDGKYEVRDRFYFEDYYISEAGTDNYIERYSDQALEDHLSQANGYNSRTNSYTYVMDNILNYNRTFDKHYLDLTLVATRDYSYSKNVFLSGSDFSDNGNSSLGVNGISKATTVLSSQDIIERSNVGYLARLAYTYNDRYHLNASIRRDGASVFGANQRFGNFPSGGVAWTASNEDFLNGNETLSYLKLKASYGQNGNQGLNPYQTLALVANGSQGNIEYEFGDAPSTILYGVSLTSLASPNLGWETTTTFNTGFQSKWLNDLISLDFDLYFSKTTDQIFVRNIPTMTGFSSILTSLGQVNNNGLEINIGTTNIKTEDFSWNSNLIYTRNRNKIEKLYGDDLDGDGKEDDDIANSLFIGEPIGTIFGYEYDGVVQADDTDYIANVGAVPGDAKFKDLDGDGFITAENDRKILGYRRENFRMSLSNTLNYKDFTFYVLLNGVFGGNNYYMSENPLENSFGNRFDTNEINHDWWTPENQSEKYLRPDYLGNRYLGLQSRGFVRVQDISLSYNFPQDLLNKINIRSAKIFASAHNLYTFTDWFGGGDPELGIRPGSGAYPVPTTVSVGVNLSL